MKARNLILVILLALFSFGGTFTCKATNDSDGFTEKPATPAK
jgi:hypothetical protein